ncbi:MAG: alkaline phosphatase family protein [Chloroflexi bacterium]|nr:alkaline phosphatase family protein [Chloroflexota bacterium]
MPVALAQRLRDEGLVPPDYEGHGLLNVAATVLDVLGLRDGSDPPPLADLDPALREGARDVVLILADGLGWEQLHGLRSRGELPFIGSLMARAERGEAAQLMRATTIFPSTTTAAITTLNTARTPQEHGNIAYFTWLDEFGVVAQLLRWGPAVQRRGSFFEDAALDPRTYAKVPSIHARAFERGARTYIVEPEMFRDEAMTRMHAAEADLRGYLLPSTLGVRLRELLDERSPGTGPAYVYAYWAAIDTAAHWYGPGSREEAAEAAALDLALSRAFAGDRDGRTLVLLTADHGHALVDPARLIDLEGDAELRALLRNPIAGEPRCAFLHTDRPDEVKRHLDERYPEMFALFDRDELIAAGIFGRGDPSLAQRRIGEVCAIPRGDRGATIVRVDGQVVRHRGSHGGMSPAEMLIPILAWRV